MNYRQAIKIMSDLVPKNITWSLDLEHFWHDTTQKHSEGREVWIGHPIRKFFGNRDSSWQSAVDQALVHLRNEGLID